MQIVAKQTLYKPQKNVRLRTNPFVLELKEQKKKNNLPLPIFKSHFS